MAIAPHQQAWVKVNTLVDSGLRNLIRILSTVPHLQTIDSCQGERNGRAGWIYFCYGNWQQCTRFVFGVLGPALKGLEGVSYRVEIFNGSDPMGKIGFRAEALPIVSSALKKVLVSHHRCQFSRGKGHREPRN